MNKNQPTTVIFHTKVFTLRAENNKKVNIGNVHQASIVNCFRTLAFVEKSGKTNSTQCMLTNNISKDNTEQYQLLIIKSRVSHTLALKKQVATSTIMM